MKTKNLLGLLLLFLCSFHLPSCSDDDFELLTMTVSSTPGYSCTFYGCSWPVEVMVVSEDGRTWQYFSFGGIEGFQYERGYEYLIRVKKSEIEFPPADASSLRYELVSVLSKEKKEPTYGVMELNIGKTTVDIESNNPALEETISKKVLANMLPVDGGYRFVYTDPDHKSGEVWTYTSALGDVPDKIGTFVQNPYPEEDGTVVYTLTIAGKEKAYFFKDNSRSPVVDGFYAPYFLDLDVTEDYKADYPGVESIVVRQYIHFVDPRELLCGTPG
ncbi:DUF4377 domain-containing protein [Phocaeicola sp.]